MLRKFACSSEGVNKLNGSSLDEKARNACVSFDRLGVARWSEFGNAGAVAQLRIAKRCTMPQLGRNIVELCDECLVNCQSLIES
jgi:hypothetical protein